MSNAIRNLTDNLREFLKPCSVDFRDEAVAGFGAVLEKYDCATGDWVTLICGQDIQAPKRVGNVLDTTGAAGKEVNPADGKIYNTYQPSPRVNLDTLTYTAIYTDNNYLNISTEFGKLTTYRVVAADVEHTFWAFNAIVTEDMVNFPSGESDTGMIEITMQPSGYYVWDKLNPMQSPATQSND